MPDIVKNNSLLMDPDMFAHAHKVGELFAASPLFPEHLRKGPAGTGLANGILVLDMANRMGRPPLEVAQNIYFVSGKPGWSSSYLIGMANESGKLKKKINWEVTGQGDALSVRAFATLMDGEVCEYTVTMAMAKAEGWTKNRKYQTLPELMLRYRSAAALIRLYMPEITMGIPDQSEANDPQEMRDVTPQSSAAPADTGDLLTEAAPAEKPKAKRKPKAEPKPQEPVEDAQEIEAAPEQDAEDVARFESLTVNIIDEIDACDDPDMLTDVADLYEANIEQVTAFSEAMGARITAAITKRETELSPE